VSWYAWIVTTLIALVGAAGTVRTWVNSIRDRPMAAAMVRATHPVGRLTDGWEVWETSVYNPGEVALAWVAVNGSPACRVLGDDDASRFQPMQPHDPKLFQVAAPPGSIGAAWVLVTSHNQPMRRRRLVINWQPLVDDSPIGQVWSHASRRSLFARLADRSSPSCHPITKDKGASVRPHDGPRWRPAAPQA